MENDRQCAVHDCSLLLKEVGALEQLVDRYQQELTAQTTCSTCGRRAGQSLRAVEEELFEHQQLNALQWSQPSSGGKLGTPVPYLTRHGGESCVFDDIRLPSNEWEWTSDWRIDIHSQSDANGWIYATEECDLDVGRDCRSERAIEDRVRRRRWKRQRKFVGSNDLSPAVARQLEQERRLCSLEHENEKLTDQLQRANRQIVDYEDRLKAYETQLIEMQRTSNSQLNRPPSVTMQQLQPTTSSLQTSSITPFSPSKSREVLHQTEVLLNQILGTAPVLDTETIEVQRRRSQMVEECQSELDSAVDEFQSLMHGRAG